MGKTAKKPIILNSKVNKLTILKLSDKTDKKGTTYYKCQCDCGKHRDVTVSELNRASVSSCTDCAKFGNSRLRVPAGESGFLNLFINYRNRAKTKNITFNIDKDDFRVMTKLNCYYCNKEPSQAIVCTSNSKVNAERSSYIYNGIDRIDSGKGYELENCVSCCKSCNMAKLVLGFDEFLSLVERIYKYRVIQRYIQVEALGDCSPLETSLTNWVPDSDMMEELRKDLDVFLLQPKSEDKSETKE